MGRILGHRNAKPDGDKRICLRCDREFTSLGRFNRICTDCEALKHESVTMYRVVLDNRRGAFHARGIIR